MHQNSSARDYVDPMTKFHLSQVLNHQQMDSIAEFYNPEMMGSLLCEAFFPIENPDSVPCYPDRRHYRHHPFRYKDIHPDQNQYVRHCDL